MPTPDAGDEAFGAAPLYRHVGRRRSTTRRRAASSQVAEDDAPLPRAFHQAAFVGATDDGKYQILLVGGATADPASPAFGVNTGAAPGPRIVPFDTSGTFPNPLRSSAAAAELLVYDPGRCTRRRAR